VNPVLIYKKHGPNLRLLLAFCLLLTTISCSTKKHKWANRAYHNTTSRFNGYFNGGEVLKEGVGMLDAAHTDNYYKVLPVFRTGTLEDSKTIIPLADKGIKKASTVIAKHNMMIRGKQYNKYIDDSYLLLGQANYYKREYYTALEMFTYVTREPVKNSKKDPIVHVANMWQARAYIELGMVSDAQSALDRSLNDKTLPNKIKGDLYATVTDFYLRQNNFPKALESIKEAVKYTKNKKKRSRYLFIEAQLLQLSGELKAASGIYARVLKMNPSYEMAFYSKINIARTYSAEGGNSVPIRALLSKMLNDPKNFDFIDQIYYVFGEIEEKEEQPEKAIGQYNKSIRASTTNTNQKGVSHLAIAEIYFEDRDYKHAAVYYDSAVTSLSKDYPDYKKVENIKNSLAELVKKYETIELYDSLLMLSGLSKEQLAKRVEEMIKKEAEQRQIDKEKEEERLRLQQIQDSNNNGGTNSAPGGPGVTGNGLPYFQNPAAMGFGFSEFKKIWGERKLEDNWRRSNKQTVLPLISQDPDDTASVATKEPVKAMTHEDSVAVAVKRLTQAIPTSDSTKRAYADSVREAYYSLGMIYKERLNDLRKAAETFEDFNNRYPGNSSEASVFYQLYRIYLKIPDPGNAEKYKNRLVTKYPDSEYARILMDPKFFEKINMTKNETENYYAETYRMYQARQYGEVINRCRTAELRFTGNDLMPKFMLLKAMAIGQMKDVAAFRTALTDVVKGFPSDGVKVKAQILLDGLDKAVSGGTKRDTSGARKQVFAYTPDTVHYFVVVVEDLAVDLNDFKTAFSNFNTEFFSTKDLKITTRLLGTNYQVVTVSEYPNKKEGMGYIAILDSDDSVFTNLDMNTVDAFLISAQNFLLLMKEGKVAEYMQFYKNVYE